jgi:hypothetical protein
MGWVLLHIGFPLLPFFLGALLRYSELRIIDDSAFDLSRFSFSMAILSGWLIIALNKITDTDVRQSWQLLFTFIIIFFVVVFTVWVTSDARAESERSSLITSILKDQQPDQIFSLKTREAMEQLTGKTISSVALIWKILAYVLGALTVLLALIVKMRYKLQD